MRAVKEKKATKDRLLDTAERLFADDGIRATSLRAITEKARANLAAVNYHFRSKEALIEAVFARRLIPLNAERIHLLDDVEVAAGARRPSIESVLRAFFIPEFRLWQEHPHFMRLSGRLQYEPDPGIHQFFLSHFQEVIRRFDAAVTRSLPEVPRKELFYRMHFLIGGMLHTWMCGADLEEISRGLCTFSDVGEVIDRLVAFGAAGLRAPVGPSSQEHRR